MKRVRSLCSQVALETVWHPNMCCAAGFGASERRHSDSEPRQPCNCFEWIPRKRQIRTTINTLFFVWCLLFTGISYSFRGFWILGAAFYSLSFFIAPPFARKYPAMRWHSSGLNGWHEDFHSTVAIADTAFVLMAYSFMAEAGCYKTTSLMAVVGVL